jgi:hypothetical protein
MAASPSPCTLGPHLPRFERIWGAPRVRQLFNLASSDLPAAGHRPKPTHQRRTNSRVCLNTPSCNGYLRLQLPLWAIGRLNRRFDLFPCDALPRRRPLLVAWHSTMNEKQLVIDTLMNEEVGLCLRRPCARPNTSPCLRGPGQTLSAFQQLTPKHTSDGRPQLGGKRRIMKGCSSLSVDAQTILSFSCPAGCIVKTTSSLRGNQAR